MKKTILLLVFLIGVFSFTVKEQCPISKVELVVGAEDNFYLLLHKIKAEDFFLTVLWVRRRGYEIIREDIHNKIKLTPGRKVDIDVPPGPRLETLMQSNELILEFVYNGKVCYFPIKYIITGITINKYCNCDWDT